MRLSIDISERNVEVSGDYDSPEMKRLLECANAARPVSFDNGNWYMAITHEVEELYDDPQVRITYVRWQGDVSNGLLSLVFAPQHVEATKP